MTATRGPVDIVGLGCCLPGARDVAAFRARLADGADPFEPVPSERFNRAAHADVELPPTVRAALVEDVEPTWQELRVPPAQLALMHRMEKVALVAVRQAVADAGVEGDPELLERTRVLLAAPTLGADPRVDHSRRIRRTQHARYVVDAIRERLPQRTDELAALVDGVTADAPRIEPDSFSAAASITAGRIANLFDFRGGHLAVDAGLASSLAAVDVAVASLAAETCDCAVVCAVSPLVSASAILAYAAHGYLSGDRPRPFAADADGTLLGEGAIAVVLTRAATRARAYASIESIGSAVDVGDTAAAVVEAARRAGAVDVDAVESRACGIADADGAEARGLAEVYGAPRVRSDVATFGFLQGAAGLVALVRAALTAGPGAAVAVSDAGLAPTAYHALVRNRAAARSPRRPRPEPLAIVGAGLLVPGAEDVETFWDNIVGGASFVGEFPPARWDVDAFLDPREELGTIVASRLAAVTGHAPQPGADAAAELAVAAGERALADAGYDAGRWDASRVQVVFGQLALREPEVEVQSRALFAETLGRVEATLRDAGVDEAGDIVAAARARFEAGARFPWHAALAAFSGAGCAHELARRQGFTGGAVAVDAACASSLAALELAAERLLLGEADAVVAGGVAWNLVPEYYIILSALGALSSVGAPPFDARRDGFVPGEGAGAVVLRRLADAQADGDRIRGVLRGIGAASDGRGRSVFAPAVRGQRLAVERALAAAGVTAAEIDYLEAHGTGTKLGDETEIESYATAFAGRSEPLRIGSVKSQIGHLSSAAGIAGLIKTCLALEREVVPPGNGNGLDPSLPVDGVAFDLLSDPIPWPKNGGRRIAGVSAFGLGGINYHAVLERRAAATVEPPAALRADRFKVELAPVSLPAREPRFPLRGRRVLLVGEHPALEAALRARGAVLQADDADVIVDVSAFGRTTGDLLPHVERTFELLARAYDRLESVPGAYVAVTSLGGDLGLTGAGRGNLLGAFQIGLAKALKQELPQSVARAVDVDPGAPPEEVAAAVVRELEDGGERLEVGYAGRRLATSFARTPAPEPLEWPYDESAVFLFSGGGRGVVYECACAVAERGARAIVCGRTPTPDPSLPWLELDDAAFAAFRLEELKRRAHEEGVTPAQFTREFESVARQRELHRNLERARRLRLPLEYAVCDVTDADELRALVERIRRDHGRIDVVVHGAMVERSARLPRKTPDGIRATAATKVTGLVNLLEATRADDLKAVVCFGSGSGRFGLQGQTDYSGANAMMAAVLAAERRPAHRVTIDWTAWEDVGAAVSDPDVTELVKATGVTWVTPEEGRYWFLAELARRESGEVVIFEERMLRELPFAGETAVAVDDRGLPLVPGEWPLVDYAAGGTVERRFDVARDAFLEQHRLYGTPILPATFGCELAAEAAALSSPGWEVAAVRELVIGAPLKLHREEPLSVRVETEVVEEAPAARIVRVQSSSSLSLRGTTLAEQRVHHTALVQLVRERLPVERPHVPEVEAASRAHSFFEDVQGPVTLGALFLRASEIRVGGREVTGWVDPPDRRAILARSSDPVFRVDPLLLDCALQIAANWDGCERGLTSIPLAIEEVACGRARRRDERACVHATVREVRDPVVVYDLVVVGEDGELLLRVNGAELRRLEEDE